MLTVQEVLTKADFYLLQTEQISLSLNVIRSKDEEIELVSEVEFFRDAPNEISKPVSKEFGVGFSFASNWCIR